MNNLTYLSSHPTWNTSAEWHHYIDRYNNENPNHNFHFIVNFITHGPWGNIRSVILYQKISEILESLKDQNKKIIIILDAHTEGSSWIDIKDSVSKFFYDYNIPYKQMIHWSGSRPSGNEPINVIQNLSAFSLITPIEKLNQIEIPTHHFVMLGRIARAHRVAATIEVLSRNLLKFGKVSCGCMLYEGERTEFENIPIEYQHMFPLTIDGYFTPNEDSISSDNTVIIPEVAGAFCQVIGESSHDTQTYGWTMPFPTEKTEKCFLLGQVPLFNGSENLALNMRELGFDLFDDLVDHTYDSIQNPTKRLKMLIDQLEKICSMTLDQLIKYKLDNIERFKKNTNLCYIFRQNFSDFHYQKLKNCLDTI